MGGILCQWNAKDDALGCRGERQEQRTGGIEGAVLLEGDSPLTETVTNERQKYRAKNLAWRSVVRERGYGQGQRNGQNISLMLIDLRIRLRKPRRAFA